MTSLFIPLIGGCLACLSAASDRTLDAKAVLWPDPLSLRGGWQCFVLVRNCTKQTIELSRSFQHYTVTTHLNEREQLVQTADGLALQYPEGFEKVAPGNVFLYQLQLLREMLPPEKPVTLDLKLQMHRPDGMHECSVWCYLRSGLYAGPKHEESNRSKLERKGSDFERHSYPPNGEEYISTIRPAKVAASPEWSESESNPPLSAQKALAIADRTLRETLKGKWDFSLEVRLDRLSLVRIGNKRWCWEAAFEWEIRKEFLKEKTTGERPYFLVFILMDGTVVTPEIVPTELWNHNQEPRNKSTPLVR